MERGVWLVSLQSLYKLPSIHALRYPAGTIFDPLCFLAFLVRTAKEILQDLCRIKSGWDDEIPDEYSLRWESWLADLLKLSILTVSRCLKPADFGQVKSSQLHRFSDASEAAFGWASFLRLINNIGKVDCSFQIGIASCALESRFDSMLRTLSRDRFCTPGKDVQERVICATECWFLFSDRQHVSSLLCEEWEYAFSHVRRQLNRDGTRWFNSSSVAPCRRCSDPRWLCVKRDDRQSLDDLPKLVNGAGVLMEAGRRLASGPFIAR